MASSIGALSGSSLPAPIAQSPTQAAPLPSAQAPRGLVNLPRNVFWPFKGDRLVKVNLVLAAVSAAGVSPVSVLQGLQGSESISEIAGSSGKSAADVLAVYDETVEFVFDQAQKKRRLPASLAQSRIDWYEGAARQMVDQPGLAPVYPGLHELHIVLITAAVRAAGLDRATVRDELKTCKSLDDILKDTGHIGQEVVDAAMQRLDMALDRLAAYGKLDAAQKQTWSDSIRTALLNIMQTPGLHVAGKVYAQ